MNAMYQTQYVASKGNLPVTTPSISLVYSSSSDLDTLSRPVSTLKTVSKDKAEIFASYAAPLPVRVFYYELP